jgi:hypothetical protein
MKKISYLVLLAAGITATSCTKDDNNTGDNYMRCKLNGTLWQSTTDNVGGIYSSLGQMVTFSGDDGTTLITANIAGVSDTGSYAMGPGTGRSMSFHYNNTFYYINADMGTGTFHFKEIKDLVAGSANIEAEFYGVAVTATNDSLFVTEGEVETF